MATVAAAVAAIVTLAVLLAGDDGAPSRGSVTAGAVYGEQRVVVWTVWDQARGGKPFVAVLASGGGKGPAAVTVPENTASNVTGRGPATIEEAAAGGDFSDVAATVENFLGVRVDGSWGIPIKDLGRIVGRLGGIQAGLGALDGPESITYLRDAPDVERAIRWKEVVAGILQAIPGHPDVLGSVPPMVRSPFGGGGREVVALPTEDIGAGLLRPDEEAVDELVAERLVPTATEDEVRLVVLNGNGIPGIGEEVARILVPNGFSLVASQNAASLDQEETRLVASSPDFVDDARRARRLLGIGRVYLSGMPTYLADVTIIVGKDFELAGAGGP
jgi:LytR cell envelope-related transcriptional attenuator